MPATVSAVRYSGPMGRSPMTWLLRPAMLRTLWAHLRLAVRLVREPSVPIALKALLALPLFYVVWPIDVLPDLVPLLGQLDDLGVLLLALESFLKIVPSHAVSFHRDAISGGRPYSRMKPTDVVIDAQFRRG